MKKLLVLLPLMLLLNACSSDVVDEGLLKYRVTLFSEGKQVNQWIGYSRFSNFPLTASDNNCIFSTSPGGYPPFTSITGTITVEPINE